MIHAPGWPAGPEQMREIKHPKMDGHWRGSTVWLLWCPPSIIINRHRLLTIISRREQARNDQFTQHAKPKFELASVNITQQ